MSASAVPPARTSAPPKGGAVSALAARALAPLVRLPLAVRLAITVIAALAYALAARSSFVPWHDAVVLPVVLAVAMVLLRGASARQRWTVLSVVTLVLLLGALASVWRTGFGGRNHVFGAFIALSDARGYLTDAERVLHGVSMTSGGARRPLFSAALAGVLRLVGNDLGRAYVVVACGWALSIAFATLEVRQLFGGRAATIVFVVLVLFARRYVGFVQSEGLGAPLGACAFGLFCRACRGQKAAAGSARDAAAVAQGWELAFLAALGLQTLALLARPGPMLLVPALVAWGVARAARPRRFGLFLRASAIVALVLLVEKAVEQEAASMPAYSDLPAILYGWLHGESSSWVWTRNAWLEAVPANARPGAVWQLLGHEAIDAPWKIVIATLRCVGSWFVLPQGFFGFVWLNPDDRVLENAALVRKATAEHGVLGPVHLWVSELGAFSLVNAVVMALAAVVFVGLLVRAIVRAIRTRRSPERSPLVLPLLGIAASLLFLPPWITEGAQINASVFLWIVVFAASGGGGTRDVRRALESSTSFAPVLAGVVVLVLVLAAWIAPVVARPGACAGDGLAWTEVLWAAESRFGQNDDPTRKASDVALNLAILKRSQPKLVKLLEDALPTGGRIVPAYDICRNELDYVLERTREAAPSTPRDRWLWWATRPTDVSEIRTLAATRGR